MYSYTFDGGLPFFLLSRKNFETVFYHEVEYFYFSGSEGLYFFLTVNKNLLPFRGVKVDF